jgi:hypothetical protein
LWYIRRAGRPVHRRCLARMNGLDELWSDLLSGDSQRIQRAWDGLDDEQRRAVLDHLERMRDEAGWHPTQRESAAAALHVLHDPAR